MVSFRGPKKLGPRPDRSPLGDQLKISDEHPHPSHMRSPPPREIDPTSTLRLSDCKSHASLTLFLRHHELTNENVSHFLVNQSKPRYLQTKK